MNFLLIYVKNSLEKWQGNSSRKVIHSLTYGASVAIVLCMNGRNKRLGHNNPGGSKGLKYISKYFESRPVKMEYLLCEIW